MADQQHKLTREQMLLDLGQNPKISPRLMDMIHFISFEDQKKRAETNKKLNPRGKWVTPQPRRLAIEFDIAGCLTITQDSVYFKKPLPKRNKDNSDLHYIIDTTTNSVLRGAFAKTGMMVPFVVTSLQGIHRLAQQEGVRVMGNRFVKCRWPIHARYPDNQIAIANIDTLNAAI